VQLTQWVRRLGLLAAVAVQPAARRPIPANTVITLQRGACEHRCAVYRIVLFADGTIIYDGRHYVRRMGVIRSSTDEAAVAKLVQEFEAINFFALQDQYGASSTEGCTSVLSDAPLAMISIVSGDKAKSVVHHHRCEGDVPKRLSELEDKIDRVANSVRWIK